MVMADLMLAAFEIRRAEFGWNFAAESANQHVSVLR